MNGLLPRMLLACALFMALGQAVAEDSAWPRTLPVDGGLVTIYPLQAEDHTGDVVRYRAALAWRPQADAEPVFGAGWFESKVSIDLKTRLVHPSDLRLTDVRFPDGTADLQAELASALTAQSPGWNLDYSLDQLNSELAETAAEQKSLQDLNTAPPAIVYRDHPALLVTLDGDPVIRQVENSPLQAVINTPYPLLYDGRQYYLNAMKDVWYSADRATGPYRYTARPPAAVSAMVKPDDAAVQAAPAEPVTAANAPEIVVATRPTELIVTEGPAVFVPLVDDLLVLQNSDDDVFMDVTSQQYYIVLAGRWYHSGSLNGPWSYQPADQLPPAFADIPPDSAQGESRVYVAGTPEAKAAVLDAQVPQTAAVERGPADVDVSYDGEPDFQPVDGTDMQYAANTGATVLRADRRYYLVQDGVWYVADNPNGPWAVSAWRPQSVNLIAPTSPVYPVRYVYIYDYTPDVVYVGYTPGYLGSYVYYNTVVFGTGWYYSPWVSPYYYYPRPYTWGFHVGYNYWSGWSFGLSWNWGWGWGWSPYYASYWCGGYWHYGQPWYGRYYGYWGPRGYRPRPAPYYHTQYGRTYAQNGRGPYRGDYRGEYRGQRAERRVDGYGPRRDNLYRDSRQQARVVATRDNLPRQYVGVPGSRAPQRSRGDSARATPVSASDLQLKAQIRDANRAASRSPMVADSNGKVRSKAVRQPRLESVKDSPAPPSAGNSHGSGQTPVRATASPHQRAPAPAAQTPAPRSRSDDSAARTGRRAGPSSTVAPAPSRSDTVAVNGTNSRRSDSPTIIAPPAQRSERVEPGQFPLYSRGQGQNTRSGPPSDRVGSAPVPAGRAQGQQAAPPPAYSAPQVRQPSSGYAVSPRQFVATPPPAPAPSAGNSAPQPSARGGQAAGSPHGGHGGDAHGSGGPRSHRDRN